MTLSLPRRSSRSRLDPLPRSRWVIAVCIAAGLHLLALGALLVVRPNPLQDAETPQDLVVSLITEPATEVSPSPIPPGETPTMQAEPEPTPPPLSDPQQPPVTETPPPPPPEMAAPANNTEPAAARPLPPPELTPPPEVQPPRPPEPAVAPRAPAPHPPKPSPAQPRVAVPPKNAAPPSSTAPAETRGPSSIDFIGRYRNSLAEFIRPYQRYPNLARMRHQEGVVVLQVTIKRDGEVTALSVQHGSGFEALDREALAALQRAAPLPPIPEGLPGATLDLEFSLHFHLE